MLLPYLGPLTVALSPFVPGFRLGDVLCVMLISFSQYCPTVLHSRSYIANPKCISEMASNVVELHPHIRGDTVLGKFRLISSTRHLHLRSLDAKSHPLRSPLVMYTRNDMFRVD